MSRLVIVGLLAIYAGFIGILLGAPDMLVIGVAAVALVAAIHDNSKEGA